MYPPYQMKLPATKLRSLVHHCFCKIFLFTLLFTGLAAGNRSYSQCLRDVTDTLPITVSTSGSETGFPGISAFADSSNAYTGWKTLHNPEPFNESWILVHFTTGAQVARGYSITALDDSSGTTSIAPANWQLQASNDSLLWTTLDIKAGENFGLPGETHIYHFNNASAFSYYRLLISQTGNTSSDTAGIASIQLFADVCLTGTVFSDNGDRASAFNPISDTALAGVDVSIVTTPAGTITASTVTDAMGNYFFNANEIPAAGSFSVIVTPPAGRIFTTQPANLWNTWIVLPSPEEEPPTGAVYFDFHKTGSVHRLSAVNRLLFPGGNLDFGFRNGIPSPPFTCGNASAVNLVTAANNGNFGNSTTSWLQAHPHQKGFAGISNTLYSSIPSSCTDYIFMTDPGIDTIISKGVLIEEGVYTISAFPGTLSDINDVPYTNSLLNNVHGGWRKTYGATTADAYDQFLAVNGATTGTLPFFKQTGLTLVGGSSYTLAFNGKHANSFAQVGSGFADAQLVVEVLDVNNSIFASGTLGMAAPVSFAEDRPESAWQNLSFSFTAPGNSGPYTVQLRATTTIANGNDFYIDNIVLYPCAMVLLPLNITSFSAATNSNGNNKLIFSVNNPVAAIATIQHSTDGVHFDALDTLQLNANGTAYAYTHSKPLGAINYYRVELKDMNGRLTYSAIKKTDAMLLTSSAVTVYPNPVADKLFIQSNTLIQQITVINMSGQTLKIFPQVNASLFQVDSRLFQSGVYYFKIAGKDKTTIHKVVIGH